MRLFHFSLLFTFVTGFNTLKEEYPDASRFPHTDPDSDLASPSPDGSPGVTRIPDVFRSRFAHTVRGVSVRQGGGRSASADKTRFAVVSQESTHNGQEMAGGVISDLTHTATHSLTDSTLSFTGNDSGLSGAETQPAGVSEGAPTTTTRSRSNTDVNTLQEKVPQNKHSYLHYDANKPLVRPDAPDARDSKSGDITVMSSAPTGSGPHLSTRASVTDHETSESHRFHNVTNGDDTSVMSLYAVRNAAHNLVETFRTKSPHHVNRNNSDLSVTDKSIALSDSVSDLEVSEFNSVTYASDGSVRSSAYMDTAETVSRTNPVPYSTRIVSESDSVTDVRTATVSHRQIGTSAALSASRTDATEKSTEYYSNTPYNTNSLQTNPTATDSATTPPSRTVRGEHATLRQQATYQWMHGDNMQHTSSDPPPVHTESPSSPVTPTGQDFTPTSASYTLGTHLGDPIISTTLHSSSLTSVLMTHRYDHTMTLGGLIMSPYGTTETKSIPEVQTQNHTNEITTVSDYPSLSTESRPRTSTLLTSSTPRDVPMTPTTPTPAGSRLTSPSTHALITASPRATPVNPLTSQMTSLIATTRRNVTQTRNLLTTSKNTAIVHQPGTTATTLEEHTLAHSQPGTHTPLTTQTSIRRTATTSNHKDWSQKGQVFIMADQPAIINVETFQVLLQVTLEENRPPHAGLLEVEPFLQKVAGYQSQHVTWHSGPVLQSVVTFRTAEAVSWLGRAESLLQEAGLKPLPSRGVFVNGIRVENMTVGGLHGDACSWVFSCPTDFHCVSSERNVSCRSVCHSEYCKNHGICVHRPGQHPVCQCPVGEDFWFMGQRCDLHMTRQRLAGVCFGVLATITAGMGLLAFLAVQRFKKMLIQAKAEQTQSSYRRFNHFDELSARFWRRSWPGSEDSLDHTAFSRSDELLHMRALDRACCYHDDTLSIASTYPDSATRLNTVYPHSSQYHWDMSTCSLADGVIDSGKASDLSVCSWPIEPIQWTPFPLLQQLGNTNSVKPSHPRSYCEGMELVGLEKSRTA